ncbi:PDZ domain-containing protein [Lederbergia sp. NSJ-179]|uniref:SepM family pheromone-processing serine protease n=1 Tax=Lederbergia sp. NSJ-179 TaxID=2931402 RepID=UPI001FD5D4D1|nr:SepM family pheromone-processing serine protease [Lederbergia sp. NSJ-179]MCJ7841515.1 PDZ domain-containing protein [Lederbergia sp. NSJ-179]
MSSAFSKQRKKRILATVIVLVIISLFIPTPYYLYQPGSVEELGTKVTVEGGEKDPSGNLYLTTVLSMRASNIYYLAYGWLAPHTDMRKVKEVRGDLSDEEYSRLLKHMMESSQNHAFAAGLRAAGEKVDIKPTGVFVRDVREDTDAKGKLEVGDVIHQVDDQSVSDSNAFLEYLSHKKSGDIVELQFDREGTIKKESIELVPLTNSVNKAGIGIVTESQFNIEPSREIRIDAGDIGGPSAGLMFSLEIYNQITPGNLTKGYEIAGTGEIDMDGNVGQIGGIREKITAVERAGIDIFFCPADIGPYDSNEKDVLDEVKTEGYKVKIVPVKTLQEAINYLEKLPPKE